MARRNPPRKVTYFEPVRRASPRNTNIESTFDVGRRFRRTMGSVGNWLDSSMRRLRAKAGSTVHLGP
jgi:hypothetical protein